MAKQHIGDIMLEWTLCASMQSPPAAARTKSEGHYANAVVMLEKKLAEGLPAAPPEVLVSSFNTPYPHCGLSSHPFLQVLTFREAAIEGDKAPTGLSEGNLGPRTDWYHVRTSDDCKGEGNSFFWLVPHSLLQ